MCPFWLLFRFISFGSNLDIPEILWALGISIKQSTWSALFSVLLGIFLSWGLFYFQSTKWHTFPIRYVVLMPSLLPTLFILIGVMNLLNPLPLGSFAVIFSNVFINVGLVAVILFDVAMIKLQNLAELSMVLGASRFNFITKIYFQVLKSDILKCFFLVFAFSFSNFSVSMIMGSGIEANLDILIYEKLKIHGDLSGAYILTLFQSVILFIFSLVLIVPPVTFLQKKSFKIEFLESKFAFFLIGIISLLFFISYTDALTEGMAQLKDLSLFKEEIISGILGTGIVALGTGLTVFFLLWIAIWIPAQEPLHKILFGLTTPSAILVGFSFLNLGINSTMVVLFKIIFGISILDIFIFYKMGFYSVLKTIEPYRTQSLILGDSGWLSVRRVLWPLVEKQVFLYSGIASFWAAGEFGISKVLASHNMTLALLSETFLSHYRIGIASLLSCLIVMIGFLFFLIFAGAPSVISRNFRN